MALPQGPRFALPYLIRYLRDPIPAALSAFARWGDPHRMNAFGTPLFVTANPRLIRAILDINPENFDAFGVERLGPAIGKSSIMLLGGERHRAARKLQSPPFHGSRMRSYAQLMQQIARAEAESWPKGEKFPMQRATQAISLRIILKAVLGADDPLLSRVLVDLIAALRPELLMMGALQHGWYPPWSRFVKRKLAVENWLLAEVKSRRENPDSRQDILSLLLLARYEDGTPMEDREVFESMMTLVVAGHETTALALAWAMWLLHRHPQILAKLEEEIRAVDDPEQLAALPYLDAVCQETLRIRPVAPAIVRVLNRPMKVGDYELPAGTGLNPSLIALHYNEELFPQPRSFRPERFLERKFEAHEFMPFGAGHRRCLGAAFAMFEMKIVLATLLKQRPLALANDREIGLIPRNTVLGPKRALEFVA